MTIFGSLTRMSSMPPRCTVGNRPIDVGDFLLCEVTELGCYGAIETDSGEQISLQIGSSIVGVAGTRHSSTSLSGESPRGLLTIGADLDLLGRGGLIGKCVEAPARLGLPTRLRFLGTVETEDGTNLALEDRTGHAPRWEVPIIAVVGSAALIGKTRMIGRIIERLCRSGSKVAACKLSGTGRICDTLAYRSAGASYAVDFVEAGLPTTYGGPDGIVADAARRVIGLCTAQDPDVVVVELGGDAFGGGNHAILNDDDLRRATRGVVLVGSDVFSLVGLVGYLRGLGWQQKPWFAPFRFRNNQVTDALLLNLLDGKMLTTDELIDQTLGSAGITT